jgi:hypothetical protein
MATQTKAKTIYTARSQFWVADTFFKPIDQGGRAIEDGDPILKTHKERFEEYQPRTRDFGQPGTERKSTVIARLEAPPEDEPSEAHTHPHE